MGFKRKEKGKNLKFISIVILLLVVLGAGGWLVWAKFEGQGPSIEVSLERDVLGAETKISGTVADSRSGVRKLWVGLIQEGNETVLLEKTPGGAGAGGTALTSMPFTVSIDTRELGLADGKAVLRFSAHDNSWRDWWKGNRTYVEKDVVFDTQPPGLTVLSRQHNVSQGGSGLVIYRLSERCRKSGVHVGDEFFPGYSGYFEDDSIYIALFALGYDQNDQTDLYVNAVDKAGNSSRSGFYHYIRQKRFKHDRLAISDRFLEWKIPEFAPSFPPTMGEKPLVDKFLYVNQTLRRKNNETLLSHGRETEKGFKWEGAFGRLPNSARRASFADHRVYTHNGKEVDRAVHMGVDLASVRHAEVPAANGGKVVYADEIGIYGNTAIIDHGYGLFSVYSHLSRFAVEEGDTVEKGEIIGNTGISGLTGGDHLHYGMFIDHVYVDPVEWWDPAWIENNITAKLEAVSSLDN